RPRGGFVTTAGRSRTRGHSMPPPDLEILYEDNHCLAIAKPAGRVSTHFQGGEETLDRDVKRYLKEKHHKPGHVFLGVVHRPDVAGGAAADGADASTARATRPPRPPDLRRREIRQRPHVRPGDWAARAGADVPAPGTLRADHAHRGSAATLARPLRLRPARG